MPKQMALSLLISLAAFSNVAFGETKIDVVESCAMTESKQFANSTQIICDQDFSLAPGVVLDAGQNNLEIHSAGNITFGAGSKVVSSAREANLVSLYGRTAYGKLDVISATDVHLEFASLSAQYQQSIKTQYGAEVRAYVSGQLLRLDGPENKITR